MAFRILHETDPRYLGQGAYASGLAQYDRAREQLSLQQAALNNQANQAAANRDAQMQMQNRQLQARQQQQLLGAHLQEQSNRQQQGDMLDRIEFQDELRQDQMVFDTDQKIRLTEQAYALKENEINGKIKWVRESNWEKDVQDNAIAQLRIGLSQFEAKPPPTFQELIENNKADLGNGLMAIKEEGGRIHMKEIPHPDVGKQNVEVVVDGVARYGQIVDGGKWEEYETEKVDTAKQDAAKQKAIDASYTAARKIVQERNNLTSDSPAVPTPEEIIQEMKLEQQVKAAFGVGNTAGEAAGIPSQQPQQQQLPQQEIPSEGPIQPPPPRPMPPAMQAKFDKVVMIAEETGDTHLKNSTEIFRILHSRPRGQMTPEELGMANRAGKEIEKALKKQEQRERKAKNRFKPIL